MRKDVLGKQAILIYTDFLISFYRNKFKEIRYHFIENQNTKTKTLKKKKQEKRK